MRRVFSGAIAVAVLASLAACDNGGKAVTAQVQTARAETARTYSPTASKSTVSRLSWAASKTRSSDEAAQAQFEKNGQALGATSVDDYVAEARAFIAHPPKGAQMATRPNGDVLLYDPVSNRFAVATADGAPRTLFKPREGAAYWAEQKAKAGQQARTRKPADEG